MPQRPWSQPTVPMKVTRQTVETLPLLLMVYPSEAGLPARGSMGRLPGSLQGGTTRNRLPSLGSETKGTNPTERLLNANFGLGTLF